MGAITTSDSLPLDGAPTTYNTTSVLLNIPLLMCAPDGPKEWSRITDLSALTPETIKWTNTEFLNDDDHPYDMGFQETQQEIRRKIWNTRNQRLRRVVREFPRDEPLRQQCALWIHAIVGKHFFPDANHRTAVATLRTLLRENGINYHEWSVERLREVRRRSHDIRHEIETRDDSKDVRMDTLHRRDELYEVWFQFFKSELEVTI